MWFEYDLIENNEDSVAMGYDDKCVCDEGMLFIYLMFNLPEGSILFSKTCKAP